MGFDTAESFPSLPTLPGVDLASGTRIKQYELIRELGRGGMGVVYAARDVKLGRRVAMKFLRAVDREVLDRFLVEARATAQCNHDNIVIIYEVDEHDGMPYMVLELLEGRSLRELMGGLDGGQPMPWSRVVELILPVAKALARAHELGIVHRDLKPENVLVTTAGQVKVLDFGIAKALGSGDSVRSVPAAVDPTESLTLTREGAMVGTLPYMSPEQMGVDEIDHRSDLFSLGMILWEMLAGVHPIEMTSDALLANLVEPSPMPSVRTALGDLPPGLVYLIDSCLAKSKHERMPSALELARQLEHLLPTRHARQLAEGESPYPGLTAFQEHDADRFFGRGRDVTRMVARVRELPLTAIVGPSGVGKSSFVRAGVGPALKSSGETWDVITVRPGRYPLAALASVTERMITRPVGGGGDDDHARMMRRLRAEPGYFGAALRARAKATGGNVLLFVDQFEELYTLVADAEERQLFTAALSGVADDTAAPLRVVVSMRSDFLDRVAEDPRFMEELSRGLVFLSAPDREGLREALEAPVEMVGYRFESAAMVGDMLDALANTPGALPLLQFAAAKLWDARDRTRQLLTMASYQAIGGISGALATHADDVVRTMTAAQQRLTQRVFRQLVTPERTRAIVELSDLYAIDHNRDDIARVIDTLVSARLLVVQTRGDAGGGSVELVHESLIDRWPTLRRWLDEDQDDAAFVAQLSAAAKQWDAKGRPAGMLWRGDLADEARRWYASSVRAVPPRDQAFLDAVLALARRGKRGRRIALVAVISVLGAVAVGASVAYMQMRALRAEAAESSVRATEEAEKAKAAAQVAEAKQAEAERQKAAAVAAQQARAQTQTQLDATGSQLADREKQLVEQNEELKKQQAAAVAAKEQAEAASKQAKAAAADAQRAKADLQVKLDDEKRKNKQLEDEKRKLSTKLKE